MSKTPIEDLSEFGRWCSEVANLSRSDVRHLTGFSASYVSQLFNGSKILTPYWHRFFMVWWNELFTDDIKLNMLKKE